MKLFNLTQTPKPGKCEARRCTGDVECSDMPGEWWGRENAQLCGEHAQKLLEYAEEHPEGPGAVPVQEASAALAKLEPSALTIEPQLQAQLTQYATDGAEILAIAKEFAPDGQEDLEMMNDLLRDVKGTMKEIAGFKETLIAPWSAALEILREACRPAEKPWTAAELLFKQKLAAAKIIEDRRNQQMLKAAAEANARGDTQATVEALGKVTTTSDLKGTSMISSWDFVIEDEMLLPREFLTPNVTLLKELCAHSTDGPPTAVPGIKFIPKVSVRVRAS